MSEKSERISELVFELYESGENPEEIMNDLSIAFGTLVQFHKNIDNSEYFNEVAFNYIYNTFSLIS